MSQCCNDFVMDECSAVFAFSDEQDEHEMYYGLRGPYFTPHVENGIISWTNNGGLPNPDPAQLVTVNEMDIDENGILFLTEGDS